MSNRTNAGPSTTVQLMFRWSGEDATLTAQERERGARAWVKAELHTAGFKLSRPLHTEMGRVTRYGRMVKRELGIRCWAQRGDGAVLRGVLLYRPSDPTWFRFVREGDEVRGNAGWGSVMAAIRRALVQDGE